MRPGLDPWVGKILWRSESQSVFLPGKFHGQRNLVGYSPCDCKESDTTAQLTTHCEQYKITVGNYLKEINYKHRVLKSNIRAGKAILETGKHGAETQDCQEHF